MRGTRDGIQGYKVCKACADSTEANTYLGRMLSSGIDCVKCGWVIGRCLKKKKMIKLFNDLPRPLSPTFNASALVKNPRCKSSKTTSLPVPVLPITISVAI